MKVYVAAPWEHKIDAGFVAAGLRDQGFELTSRWIDFHGDSEDPEILAREAQNDLDDIEAADVLVVLNICRSEGKAVETGFALHANKPVIVAGKRSTIFHHLPRIHHVPSLCVSDIAAAITALGS